MGLAYYRLAQAEFDEVLPLIRAHEAEILGPRARGYWFDYPDSFNYEGVQNVASQLDQHGRDHAVEALELSELEAHALSLLEVELPRDGLPFPPSLFLASLPPEGVVQHLKLARKTLGADAERASGRFAVNVRDPRMLGYLNKQLKFMQQGLPKVWKFFERAAADQHAVLVVDLRARDVFIPEAIELEGIYG